MDAETLSTIVLLGSFLLMVFLRFPIAYSVGISTVLCLLTMGQKLSVLPEGNDTPLQYSYLENPMDGGAC